MVEGRSSSSAGLRLLGVTGTNGKTSTTFWLAGLLRIAGAPVVRATTLGYALDDEAIDVPFTFEGFTRALEIGAERGAQFGAVELTSEALARGFAQRFPFELGVFTNLTHDHLDAHASPEHYLASKAQLFMHLARSGTAVLNACDPATELLESVLRNDVKLVRYGIASRGEARGVPDLWAEEVRVGWDGTQIDIRSSGRMDGAPAVLRTRAIGHVFAENAMAAYAAAVTVGIPHEAAALALAALPPPQGRFEVILHEPAVVVDYAHTPDALARTLAAARNLCRGSLIVVFGAGGGRDAAKRPAMGAAATQADRIFLTSDNPRDEDPAAIASQVASGIGDHRDVRIVLDRAAAIGEAVGGAGREDVVIIAGKGHECEQIIGKRHLPFSDAAVAKQAFAARASSLATNMNSGTSRNEG